MASVVIVSLGLATGLALSFHRTEFHSSHIASQTRRHKQMIVPPGAAWDGVIEGFYGPAWSNRRTRQMFRFMGHHHLTTFIYAPKNDPYARKNWNILYPVKRLSQLKGLVTYARSHGIRFVYSLSPGLSLIYSSVRDRQAILQKINQLRSIGIHDFMLSFDDISTQLDRRDIKAYGNNLGRAQSSLVNYVVHNENSRNSHVKVAMTPTQYYGVANTPYWESLHQYLNPRVPVTWTGPGVLSTKITLSEFQQVQKEIGHPLIIWDNYPVNDYTYVIQDRPRLMMGPVTGRSPAIVRNAAGYVFNPMLQPLASQVALWTGGAFLSHPQSYNAQQQWNLAIRGIGGRASRSFALFCQDSNQSALNPKSPAVLAHQLDTFWMLTGSQHVAVAKSLHKEFSAMALVNSHLKQHLSRGIYNEIKPWAKVLSEEGRIGKLALHDIMRFKHHTLTSQQTSVLSHSLAGLSQTKKTLATSTIINTWLRQVMRHLS